jgi:uncharacterized membrane protein
MNRRPFLIVGGAIVAFMTLDSAWAWLRLPAGAQVPIHFDITGMPDRYADKTVGLFLLPAVGAAVLAIRGIIPGIEPRREQLARSGPAYTAIAVAVVAFLALLDVVAVAEDLGSGLNIGPVVVIGIGLLFLVPGNYLSKIRSSFLFGIRTPWTLTSERSWTRTHRLGGRLFAAFGLVLMVAALVLPPTWAIGLLIGGAAALTATLVAYSYLVWRRDPDRLPSASRSG